MVLKDSLQNYILWFGLYLHYIRHDKLNTLYGVYCNHKRIKWLNQCWPDSLMSQRICSPLCIISCKICCPDDAIRTNRSLCQETSWYTQCNWHTHLPLQWRYNEHDGVSNHQPHECLLNRAFERRSKKTSKLRVTGLCAGNSSVIGEFPAQMASNADFFSILRRHPDYTTQFNSWDHLFCIKLKSGLNKLSVMCGRDCQCTWRTP